MKDLINKLIANIHIFLLFYGLYGVYERWDAHSIEYASLEAQIPDIDEKIKKASLKLKEINDFVKKAEEYKARVEEVAKSIESAQRQLPAETNDSQILGFFQKEIGLLNIKDPQVTPANEEPSTFYISKNYSVKAKGTFLQFLIFLERLGNSARIYNVKELRMTSNNVAQKGRFQVIGLDVTISAYRFNPNFKVDLNEGGGADAAAAKPGGTK